jgi:hypothetical protein
MALSRRVRFTYDTASEFITALPVRAWLPMDKSVGGARISAAGVPAAYVVRRDSLLSVTFRIEEADWAAFLAFVIFGQTAAVLQFFPDAADFGSSVPVYLHSPAAGEDLTPTRDGSYPMMLEATLVFRSADGSVLWQEYFP